MCPLPSCALACALLCSTALLSNSALPAQEVAPAIRIVDRIDESKLVTLKGNTHPAANAKNDRGRVSPDLPMTDLILVLSRSPEQQAAFEKFVASQYDSSSPNFHQWLTPEQIGQNFGPSENDIAAISAWLTSHGFSVDQVPNDHMSIRFSGKASQVESAFHTEIHNLEVKGVAHIGNMSDPQIPAAIAPAVVGVKALHNFFPRPLHHLGQQVTRDSATGKWQRVSGNLQAGSQSGAASRPLAREAAGATASSGSARAAIAAQPQFGISVTGTNPYLEEDVSPWDFATIYNVLPLWNASTPIDGTGQTIAIAGTSDIEVGQTGGDGNNDIATFRNYFDLPTNHSWNTPIRISGNSQPLTVCSSSTNVLCGQNDLIENTLDVEWSGAVAKNAQIILVSSYPASASDDNLYDSESYIVNNVTARIMNVSYGECELELGTGGNVQYYNLWSTAKSEGIAVFVASGDSGAASCDAGGDSAQGLPYPAEDGLSVSGLASTPFNTAVGGTDFNWCSLTSTTECTPAPYWSSSNTVPPGGSNASLSAMGYLPEVPWNDTCTNPLALGFIENFFKGVYTVTDAESGCNAFVVYAQSIYANQEGGILGIVDTVGGGGGASGCVVGTPVYNSSTGETTGCTASTGPGTTGTTTNPDTGAAQGSLATYNNGWPKPTWQTGVTGIPSDNVRDIPDVSFFASDGFLSGSAYLICVTDVAPCSYTSKTEAITALEVGGTSVATPAMAGVMALINQKTGASQGNPNAELYKLASTQTYSSCSAERGNGAPVTSGTCLFNDIDKGTNAMACDYSAYVTTPSPNCSLIHSTDYVGILSGYSGGTGYDLATGLGSLNVANVVNAWPKTVGSAADTVTVAPAQNSINSSNSLGVTVTVASSPVGGATPTGTVTLTASGSSFSATGTLSGSGSFAFTIPSGTLAIATDTLTASYAGDATYAPASGTATVVVNGVILPIPAVTVSPSPASINSNQTVTVSGTVSGSAGAATGNVTITAGSYTSTTALTTGGAYSFTVPANALTGSATGLVNTLIVTYGGSTVYQSATGSANVTVMLSTFTLSVPTSAISPVAATTTTGIAPGSSATATATVAAVAGYTGTVTLTCQLLSTTATGGDGADCSGGGAGSSVTLGTSGTVMFTVSTTAKTGALVYPQIHGNGRGWLGGGAVLALLVFFFGIPVRRRAWRQLLGVMVLAAVLGGLAACGGGGGGGTTTPPATDPGTTAGTYTFTVVATGTATGGIVTKQETTFNITVN
jgi:subtilase family serine protease